jgi:hypothetical protein
MEVKGAVVLYTLAGLMVTFAGFSALLLGIRQTAGAKLSALDRFLAKTVLVDLFILTAMALLPAVLALYGLAEEAVWKISAVIFALTMLSFLLSYSHRRHKVVGRGPPPVVFVVFIVFGSAVIVAMLIAVLVGFRYSAAIYITALVVNFFTLAFAFVTALDVIMQQPLEKPH